MKLLSTIYRNKGANPEGKTLQREAVRGIIFRDGKLLLIHSTVNGDYKFPGGGIEADELHVEALQREIQEECGAEMTLVTGEFGQTIEYAHAIKDNFETYKQNSYYYFCQIADEFGELALEDYEEELGFRPEWVEIETALEQNKKVLAESKPAPRWTKREAFVLGILGKRKTDKI